MKIRAADLTVHHVGQAMKAQADTDEGSQAVSGRIVWITFTEDEVRIGVAGKPDVGALDWEFSDDDLIDLINLED